MDLIWHHFDITQVNDNGVSRVIPTDFGVDESGRIFGEVRHEPPIYVALHLRKPVGRYLRPELAQAATQTVYDIITTDPQDKP